jgi:cellulose synthase/poly-beta-1,6-N-acetylglucosamine synthase-like glycosyltransferase
LTLTPLMLVVSAVLVAFDFQNLLSWWHGRLITRAEHGTTDYTIVVPLFGHPRYFDGRRQIECYKDRVLVALEMTPPHMRAFALELEAEGWRVCRMRVERPNPAKLMREALASVTTTYALRLDADTHLDRGLDEMVAAVAASGADICSVKVEADKPQTTAAKLQALEYRMAMLARHYRPWMTSGACFIGKTDSLRLIFARHSLWTPGEDIETGRAAHAMRMKIRHADFVVTTEVPATWPALFRQRRLWWAGTFRHNVVNADRNLIHLPIVTGYTILAIYATVAFKWWGMVDWRAAPQELPVVLLVYAFVTFISNIQVRSRWMLVFPLYALMQSFVMPLLGAVYYVVLARRIGVLGRYHFGYRRGLPAPVHEELRRARALREELTASASPALVLPDDRALDERIGRFFGHVRRAGVRLLEPASASA